MNKIELTRRRISLVFLLLGFAAAALGQTFTVQSGSPAGYVLRDGKRFFAIGTRVDGIKVKPIDESTFTSIREMFNTLWITIRDIDDPKHLYPDGMYTRLDYLRHDEGVFLAGDLPYRLQTERGCIIDTNGDGIFQPSEQRAAHKKVAPQAARRAMENIYKQVNPASGPKRSMIYYLMDEPDAGYATDSHWAFSDSLLKRFYDQRQSGTLAYIDLGPVTGSKLLYEKKYPLRAPDKGSPGYFASLKHSFAAVDENVRVTARTYAPAADILGINSYDATNRKPALLGDAVSWIQESSGFKPVWPWVSAEQLRYSSEQSMYSTVRPQVYSAIVHGASGLLFYNDQTMVARSDKAQIYWDKMFDLVKELDLFRDVLEDFSASSSDFTGAVQWRAFQRSVQGRKELYYFLVNTTSQGQVVRLPGAAAQMLPENECGIWLVDGNGAAKRLAAPSNLSFEVWEGTGVAAAPAQWSVHCASGTSISRFAYKAKLGSCSILMSDDADAVGKEAVARQAVPCAGGESYAVQGWCWPQSGSPQILVMQFLNDQGKVLLTKETPAPSRKSFWHLVKVSAEAPAGAGQLSISIRSGSGRQISRSYWDDLLIRMQ